MLKYTVDQLTHVCSVAIVVAWDLLGKYNTAGSRQMTVIQVVIQTRMWVLEVDVCSFS